MRGLSYTSPRELAARHGLSDELGPDLAHHHSGPQFGLPARDAQPSSGPLRRVRRL